MARLDKETHEKYMQDIMGRFENPADAEPIISALRSDFEDSIIEGDKYVPKSDYDTLKKQYVDRFFGGEIKGNQVTNNQREDINNDSKELTFDALFKNAESYNGNEE